jgi:hypothetical protein
MSKFKSVSGFLAFALIGLPLVASAQNLTTPTTQQGLQQGVPIPPPGSTPPDFDPATRMFSSKNPPLGSQTTPVVPVVTPEQQAEIDRQKQLAEIEQKRQEAKQKADAAKAAQKAREQAAKAAEEKRMAALKQMREDRMKEMKENREELAKLLQEEKDARKAYQDAKKSSTGLGGTQSLDDDYRKAEKDRQKKIQELRHPKYKPIKLPAEGSTTGSSSGVAGTPAAGTSTALPGTTTTGMGPGAMTH